MTLDILKMLNIKISGFRDEEVQTSVCWSKYVSVLIAYIDDNFSNSPALKKVTNEVMYLLYFRLLLICIKDNPCS